MRFIIIGFFVLLGANFGVQAQDTAKARTALRNGIQLLNSQKAQEALAQFRIATAQYNGFAVDPKRAALPEVKSERNALNYWIGAALLSEGKTKTALQTVEKVVKEYERDNATSTPLYGAARLLETIARLEMGDTAKAYRILGSLKSALDPAKAVDRARLAELYALEGRIYYRYGELVKAKEKLKRAGLGLMEAIENKETANAEKLQRLDEVLTMMADLEFRTGNLEGAKQQMEVLLALRQRVYGPRSLPVLEAHSQLGHYLRLSGLWQDGTREIQTALELAHQLLPANHPVFPELFAEQGEIWLAQKQYIKTQEAFRKALALRTENLGKDAVDVASSYQQLGNLARETNESDRASNFYLQALDIYRRIPLKVRPILAHARCLSALAMVRTANGKADEGLQLLAQAEKLVKNLEKPEPLELAQLYHNTGIANRNLKQTKDAERYLRMAMQMRQTLTGENTMDIAYGLRSLGELALQRREPNEAVRYYKQYREIVGKLQSESSAYYAVACTDLGIAYEKAGHADSATTQYRKSLHIFKRLNAPGSVELAQCFFNLGYAFYLSTKYDSALWAFDSSLLYRLRLYGDGSILTADSYSMSSRTLQRLNKPDAAIVLAQKALQIQQQYLKPDNALLLDSYRHIASLLRQLGKLEEAAEMDRKAEGKKTQ
jgi:hypothetical protein